MILAHLFLLRPSTTEPAGSVFTTYCTEDVHDDYMVSSWIKKKAKKKKVWQKMWIARSIAENR